MLFVYMSFQTAFVRQKTPHPKELKAKAHKLFGTKKGDSTQQNDEQFPEQNINNANEIENRNRVSETNGFGQSNIVFHEGVGTQNPINGGYEDDGETGEDENDEVRLTRLMQSSAPIKLYPLGNGVLLFLYLFQDAIDYNIDFIESRATEF